MVCLPEELGILVYSLPQWLCKPLYLMVGWGGRGV